MSKDLFHKPWFYIAAALVVGLSLALIASLFFMSRISQAEAGICRDVGRTLSEKEIRQKFMRSLVINEVRNTNYHESVIHNGRLRSGVIRNPLETDIRELMARSFESEASFEENFNIEVIAPGAIGFDVNSLSGGFMLVSYETTRGGSVTVIDSTSVHRIDNPESLQGAHKLSLYEKYRGFGNHYYRVIRTFFSRECCDNNTYGRSHDEFLIDKQKAYVESLESFDRNLAVHSDIAVVSNCGDILTQKSENGLELNNVKWIRGE